MIIRNRKELSVNRSRRCTSCKKILDHTSSKCNRCGRHENEETRVFYCTNCQLAICERCLKRNEEFDCLTLISKSKRLSKVILLSIVVLLISVLVLALFVVQSWRISSQSLTPKDNLRSYFPSQSVETWQNIFSVLDKKFPTVKSLTILHGRNDSTTECLVSKLIMVYANDNNIRIEDISFENLREEVRDYGEVLEYYRPIVEKHKIFVTDLNKISGNIARIFHSLCDEVSSPIKPSLFIFILRYDENVKHLKPSIRAGTILREVWQNLPSNELAPLLSRVVKNVIDVIPEKQIEC